MKPANNHSLFSHSELLPCLQVLKENAGEITYQALAERAQVGSRTKMKKIFKGELQIPKLALERLGETFGLNKEERCYLELLRNFEQASDPEPLLGDN